MDFDFVNYSRRSLLLFVMVANIIGWVAIIAVLYVAYLAIEWVAAENVALKATSDDRRMFIMNGVQLGYIKVPTVETDPALETIRIAVSPQKPTPATDRIVAEAEARGVEKFAKKLESRGRHQDYVAIANAFAKQLREGSDK